MIPWRLTFRHRRKSAYGQEPLGSAVAQPNDGLRGRISERLCHHDAPINADRQGSTYFWLWLLISASLPLHWN